MLFKQVQRVTSAEKIFWGKVHFKSPQLSVLLDFKLPDLPTLTVSSRDSLFGGINSRDSLFGGINSRSHDLASISHGESDNLEIAKQFM